jgi:hypothetical protein
VVAAPPTKERIVARGVPAMYIDRKKVWVGNQGVECDMKLFEWAAAHPGKRPEL